MGRRSRAKGQRREREAARLLGGVRVPLSGAAGGVFSSDVLLPNGWRVEVKARGAGWATLHRWLDGADVLALKADREPWLVVMPLATLMALLAGDGQKEAIHGEPS